MLRAVRRAFGTSASFRNKLSPDAGFTEKYASKLRARMEREGVDSLDKLKAKLPQSPLEPVGNLIPRKHSLQESRSSRVPTSSRRDESPIKPLSSILNVSKILQSPHTGEQVASLWTVYHASRSQGTGRGYLSASIPRQVYDEMLSRARKYPLFILPLPCAPEPGVEEPATEFYFMEWAFHQPPDAFSPITQNAEHLLSPKSIPPPPHSLPLVSTVLFTPLQEYKLRGSFAQPRLVLTHYPDFADTHSIVLLRGEITGSPSGGFLLSQVDAQLLAMLLQKFYVSAQSPPSSDAYNLLRHFHEAPENFDYTKLITVGNLGFSG